MLPLEHLDRIQITFDDHRLVNSCLRQSPLRWRAASIDDADALRAGGTAGVLDCTVKAPSTLGTFLRSFR